MADQVRLIATDVYNLNASEDNTPLVNLINVIDFSNTFTHHTELIERLNENVSTIIYILINEKCRFATCTMFYVADLYRGFNSIIMRPLASLLVNNCVVFSVFYPPASGFQVFPLSFHLGVVSEEVYLSISLSKLV